MSDFLAEKRQEIANRLKELTPLVEEAARLKAALEALDGASKSTKGSGKSTARKPRTRSSAGSKRGRPKGTGKRASEALAIVKAQPGVSISEMATQMGIHQNYLYRVLPNLQAEGKVRKEGRGWFAEEE